MSIRSNTAAAAAALVLTLPVVARAADTPVQGITLAQESPDQWRGSKLIGIPIYGPDNKSIGKITDVLMSHDGATQDVIVGVGGFLGIGEKDVAIPFASVNFTDTPMVAAQGMPNNNLATPGTMAAAPGAMAPADGGAAAGGGMAPAANPGLGTPGDALGNPAAPAMGMTPAEAPAVHQSTAYPDHGTIAFTAVQLKSAPSFRFAK